MRDAIRLLNSIGFFILKTQIMKTRKELIEKRDKIQKQIDNFKEETKLEVGKWYKTKHGCIFNYNGKKDRDNDPCGYGFDKGGDYHKDSNKDFGGWGLGFTTATDKLVEQALIKEAKKKGFKKGVETVCINVPNECEKILNNSSFRLAGDNRLLVDSNGAAGWVCIFQDGKWAEIIEDKKPTIDGYEMEVDDDYVKFGCAVFHENRLKELNEVIENWESLKNEGKNNRTIKSIKLCSGTEIKAEELKEVVDYLNK